LLVWSGSAQALGISGGGFDQALGCADVFCGASQTLEFDSSGGSVAAVSGTIEIDTSALTLSFSLSVVELSLVPVVGPDDNGAEKVVLTDTSYSATGLSLLDLGLSFVIGPGQTAMVSGTQTQIGASGATPFTAPDARVGGSCFDTSGGAASSLSCGLSFGQANFSFDVGDSAPETRYFQTTANILAVPEPTTAAMMGLALLGIAAAGRRR
jgi:hypothetical protein